MALSCLGMLPHSNCMQLLGIHGKDTYCVLPNRIFFGTLSINTLLFLFIHFVYLVCPQNTNLVEDVEILLPVKFHYILFSGFRGEVEMSRPIRGQGGHLVFPIGPKNTNLVVDIEILLPVKFL